MKVLKDCSQQTSTSQPLSSTTKTNDGTVKPTNRRETEDNVFPTSEQPTLGQPKPTNGPDIEDEMNLTIIVVVFIVIIIILVSIIVIVWALKREQNNENLFKGLKQPKNKPLFRSDNGSDAEPPKAIPGPAKSEPFLVKSNIDYTKPIPLDSEKDQKESKNRKNKTKTKQKVK